MTEPRDALPRHTTPTWEMELLISGATVFALMQLPGVLDAWFYEYFPRFARPLAELVMLPYLYVKTALHALIATFVLHLALRGYWVALVGLRSVHGDGVKWEGLRSGPIYRRVLQARTPHVDVLVERADNRASLVFGYGIGFALVTLTPIVLIGIAGLLAWLVIVVTRGYFAWQNVWTVVLAATIAPLLLAFAIDRFFGKRLAPDGVVARFNTLLFTLYLRLGMAMTSNYPMLVFTSRAGQRRAGIAITVGLFVLLSITFLQLLAREGELDVGNYGALALDEPGAQRVLRNEHYADSRRAAGMNSTAPFIPQRISRGDWMPLFVPFRPGRDSAAIERECELPAAPVSDSDNEQAASDAARARLLDCLARIYAPTLDGKPIADVRFDVANDARTGLRGVVAMLPVGSLAPGRHELTVRRQRQVRRASDEEQAALALHRIVFWR